MIVDKALLLTSIISFLECMIKLKVTDYWEICWRTVESYLPLFYLAVYTTSYTSLSLFIGKICLCDNAKNEFAIDAVSYMISETNA